MYVGVLAVSMAGYQSSVCLGDMATKTCQNSMSPFEIARIMPVCFRPWHVHITRFMSL